MSKIDGQTLVELVGLEASDEKVLNALQALGMEMPAFDEKFEMDGRVAVYTDDETFDIVFMENNEHSESGDPIVEQVDFYDEKSVSFSYGLHKNDSFETVVQKMGRNPDFCSKRLSFSKQWVFPFKDRELTMAVHFKLNMESINTIVVGEFDRARVEKSESIFPCNELEE